MDKKLFVKLQHLRFCISKHFCGIWCRYLLWSITDFEPNHTWSWWSLNIQHLRFRLAQKNTLCLAMTMDFCYSAGYGDGRRDEKRFRYVLRFVRWLFKFRLRFSVTIKAVLDVKESRKPLQMPSCCHPCLPIYSSAFETHVAAQPPWAYPCSRKAHQ